MQRYKEQLVANVPLEEEAELVSVGFLVVLAGSPGNAYRSTAQEGAALEYMRRGIDLFEQRWRRPEPLMPSH
jgi:hypothetical protein